MGILSFQSHVSYGHVGNAAAVFILRRMGFDVWPVHTVLYSNHPGYGGFGGAAVEPEILGDIIDGLEKRALFAECQAIIGGYLGSTRSGRVLLDAVKRIRSANSDARFYLDPVIGDRDTGTYVSDQIVEFYLAEGLGQADVIKSNAYELEVLSGTKITDVRTAVQAAQSVIDKHGTDTVVVTSIPVTGEQSLATASIRNDGAWVVTTPVLPVEQKGAGDAFMALYLGNSLRDPGKPDMALARSVSSIWALTHATWENAGTELMLVTAQDKIDAPSVEFDAVFLS